MNKRELANYQAKQKMVNALFDLIRTQSLENVFISELTDRAGVSRMAYYRNFSSKTDIIEYYLETILDEMFSLLKKDFEFWSLEYGTVFFTVMKRHKERILQLHAMGLSGMFLSRFTATNESLAGDMPYYSMDRYVLYYVAGGSYNMVIEWLSNGCRETPEQMAEMLADLIKIERFSK